MLKVICVAMFSLSFLLLAVAVACAGTATSAGRSTDTEHFSFLTWLHGLTHTANHRRGASLPRDRGLRISPLHLTRRVRRLRLFRCTINGQAKGRGPCLARPFCSKQIKAHPDK
jgi:hypothetical protein